MFIVEFISFIVVEIISFIVEFISFIVFGIISFIVVEIISLIVVEIISFIFVEVISQQQQYQSMYCSETHPGTVYWLPKIHKPDTPLRPILAA